MAKPQNNTNSPQQQPKAPSEMKEAPKVEVMEQKTPEGPVKVAVQDPMRTNPETTSVPLEVDPDKVDPPRDPEPSRNEDQDYSERDFREFLRNNARARQIAEEELTDPRTPKVEAQQGRRQVPLPLAKEKGPPARQVVEERAPVEVEEQMVTVMPRMNTDNVRIGKKFYLFEKGKAQKVPISVRNHLASKGII